jgi:NhaP-type Na+/H+ or K+/H+ antiporter
METRATGRSKRQTSYEFYKRLYKLTIGGGVAFWATTIAFSLLPIAAEFRAAFSISYIQVVLVESLLGGMIIGCFVSYFLLRFLDKIPTKSPILKSLILSFVALVIALIMLGGAASLLGPTDALRYFLIGAALNVPRFLSLGVIIGYLYNRI